jgi:uncharacterized protein
VFDACRNELQLPTKDTTKGLVPVAQQLGMFIAYASAPGRTASDRGDKSGPYAAALAAELRQPGLDHLNLFQNVKETVLASTGGAQQPWESNGLGRRVYLTGQPKPVAAPTVPEVSEASREWARVDKTSIVELETSVRRHGSSPEVDYARARIDQLKKQEVAVAAPPKEPAPAPAQRTTCLAQSSEKMLAGAAAKSFMTECEKDAVATCQESAAEKKLYGAAKVAHLKKCVESAVGR